MTQRCTDTKRTGLILALACLLLAAPTGAVTLEGQVATADQRAPIEGVVVLIGEPTTGTIHSSTPTDADGSFSVSGLEAGSYEVAVKSDAGLYVVGAPIEVGERSQQRAKVLIQPQTSARGPANTSLWHNPITATLVVLGGAIIIGVAAEELSGDEESASPS